MRSPKHKFRVELSFPKPLEGVGSVVSYTGDDLELLKALVHDEFDWHIIESYER